MHQTSSTPACVTLHPQNKVISNDYTTNKRTAVDSATQTRYSSSTPVLRLQKTTQQMRPRQGHQTDKRPLQIKSKPLLTHSTLKTKTNTLFPLTKPNHNNAAHSPPLPLKNQPSFKLHQTNKSREELINITSTTTRLTFKTTNPP